MIKIIITILGVMFFALFLKTAIEFILYIPYAIIMKIATQKDVDWNGRAGKIIEIVSICVTVLLLLRPGYESILSFF